MGGSQERVRRGGRLRRAVAERREAVASALGAPKSVEWH